MLAGVVTPVQKTFIEALEFASEFTPRLLPHLVKHLDSRGSRRHWRQLPWHRELVSTGTASIRRRRIAAGQAAWRMALMRDLPITEGSVWSCGSPPSVAWLPSNQLRDSSRRERPAVARDCNDTAQRYAPPHDELLTMACVRVCGL
jgi:hypothetical protein